MYATVVPYVCCDWWRNSTSVSSDSVTNDVMYQIKVLKATGVDRISVTFNTVCYHRLSEISVPETSTCDVLCINSFIHVSDVARNSVYGKWWSI